LPACGIYPVPASREQKTRIVAQLPFKLWQQRKFMIAPAHGEAGGVVGERVVSDDRAEKDAVAQTDPSCNWRRRDAQAERREPAAL
jgi:hypothetical protein